MRRSSTLLLLAGLLVGCKGDDTDTIKTDTDTDTDADTDADTDITGGSGIALVGCTVTPSAASITSRDTVTFSVVLDYSDGSSLSVSGATLSSSDEAVLKFYDAAIGQPLLGGNAMVTAQVAGQSCTTMVQVTVAAADAGDLVINEFLADGTVNGDPNADGTFDAVEDEFIELFNGSGATLDLSDVEIREQDFAFLPRHVFAAGTLLRAGESVVVFGGGDVSNLSSTNTLFMAAFNSDPGTQYGLNLNDDGDTITVRTGTGTVITTLSYGVSDTSGTVPTGADESITRSPDMTGTAFVAHSTAAGAAGDYSPGTLVNGAGFPGPDGTYP